jgi:hypothetical protein
MSAAAGDVTNQMKSVYSTTFKGTQDYGTKVLEFAHVNINAAFGHTRKLPNVKSPAEFFALSNDHMRQQFRSTLPTGSRTRRNRSEDDSRDDRVHQGWRPKSGLILRFRISPGARGSPGLRFGSQWFFVSVPCAGFRKLDATSAARARCLVWVALELVVQDHV